MKNKRDLQIISDLERFRVMSRDDIIDLHFSHLKSPITSANYVLKRLVRDKQIEVSKNFRPYVYFPHGSTIKRNSTKIPHFLKIVEAYKQFYKHFRMDKFIVEPKYSKGLAEPDAYVEVKGKGLFIEIQRNLYSQKVMMDAKIKRYEALRYSDEFINKSFPFIVMVTNSKYEINSGVITVFQVNSIQEFIRNVRGNVKSKPVKEIKIRVG